MILPNSHGPPGQGNTRRSGEQEARSGPAGTRSMGGRGARSWAPCTLLPPLLLLLSAAFPRHAAAMFQGDGKREYVHKVYKVKITENHLTQDSQLDKRAKDQCPQNYSLCSASLGGDCCPNNYGCAKDSCYATSAAVSTCAGLASYYACPLTLGGGCCPQGLLCGPNQACSPIAGATYSQTCPGTGYTQCAASLGGGCCQSGMACGSTACFNTSPSTSVIVVATTQDGSATTITSTSVFTPTAEPSGAAADVVGKIFPSTYPKEPATQGEDSTGGGGGSSGLSKGAIGGIVGGAAAVLVIFLAVAYFLVKRLNKTKRAVESRRETTSGSGTRQTNEKKSATQVSVARIQPTPSEVDAMDCDPLMVASSAVSPRGPHQDLRPGNGRSRSGSDTLSQPSGYSSSAYGPRWNTPSVDSDGGDSNPREYFSLPPRTYNQLGGRRVSEVSSNITYHQFAHGGRHGRNHSNASELSAGSDEQGSQHGIGSPLMGPTAVELSNECGFVPELPGSDTETESNGPHGASGRRTPQPRRRSSGVVSPISVASVNKPPLTHANLARRRGNSGVSPMDGQNGTGARGRSDSSVATESRLGSIDESAMAAAPATNSMHGYFGSPTTAVGQTAAGGRADFDTPPLPGFVSLGPPPSGNQAEHGQGEKWHQ